MTEHAKLSASGAHRWILCPGSVKAEENIPEQSNKYADEGTLAHEVAANILRKKYVTTIFTNEMVKYCMNYVDYVNNLYESLVYKHEIYSDTHILIEEKVDYSNIVPDGFGTADCIIFSCDELHVIDFKYGLNRIYAQDNMQLLLYAIGALNKYRSEKDLYNIKKVTLHIVQPRANNYSVWKLNIEDLYSYYKYINYKALEALKDDAPRIPSEEACRWCKARFKCHALANINNQVIKLTDKQDLTDNDIKYILDNAGLVKKFISSIEDNVYMKLINGEIVSGYKLVEGRSVRKLKEDIQEKLVALLGEKAYSKSIINITELDKLLTKDEVNSLVYLSKGKPRLVKDNGENESIDLDSLIFEVIE